MIRAPEEHQKQMIKTNEKQGIEKESEQHYKGTLWIKFTTTS